MSEEITQQSTSSAVAEHVPATAYGVALDTEAGIAFKHILTVLATERNPGKKIGEQAHLSKIPNVVIARLAAERIEKMQPVPGILAKAARAYDKEVKPEERLLAPARNKVKQLWENNPSQMFTASLERDGMKLGKVVNDTVAGRRVFTLVTPKSEIKDASVADLVADIRTLPAATQKIMLNGLNRNLRKQVEEFLAKEKVEKKIEQVESIAPPAEQPAVPEQPAS